MSYFHIVAELDEAPEKPVAIFMNLDRNELRTRFLKPYERGTDLLSGNAIFPVRQLRKIQVIQTEERSEQELVKVQRKSRAEIDELNRDSSVVFVSVGYGYEPQDIIHAGVDVTHTVIHGPPGSKGASSAVSALLNNGWVVGIGGGLVVAVLVWLFKLN